MLQPGDTPAGSQLVETPSGLLVPPEAADAAGKDLNIDPGDCTRDPDGRRRIVLTRDDRKALNRAILVLRAAGLGMAIGCKGTCGGLLTTEGRPKDGNEQELDAGYGCGCSRVHFR